MIFRKLTKRNTEHAPPPPPSVCFSLGITGHRAANPAFAANQARIEKTLEAILAIVEEAIVDSPGLSPGAVGRTRVHSLIADGVDQVAARMALAHGWELVIPLPFGRALNTAINAAPTTLADARALLAGEAAADAATRARAEVIAGLTDKAQVFELAERDEAVAALLLAKLAAPEDFAKAQLFAAESSERVELAARIVIEQSDLILAVWDGATIVHPGGTGHTIAAALELGAPVVWIDANAPERWRILRAPESLATLSVDAPGRVEEIEAVVRDVLRPPLSTPRGKGHDAVQTDARALDSERWRTGSNPIWHAYRRVEALFGAASLAGRFRNLRQRYEPPSSIAEGSSAAMLACARAMPGQDGAFVGRVETAVLRRFAWLDGVSASLSDTYRGGMIASFLLAPLAIIGGLAYLVVGDADHKWIFALLEFSLLAAILAITGLGQRRRWHGRWFQTRRVAEYFRHAPILLLLGVARAPGRWPRGVDASWPEWYARHALRELGLPHLALSHGYLRDALEGLLDDHVVRQRDYHLGKAARLAAAHHNLDRFSASLFALAIVSVASYLILKEGGVFGLWPMAAAERSSNFFTFCGVLLPTFGGAIAGIRYFGDFERFSAISEVTAEKLDAVHSRISLLLTGPDSALDYGRISDLAHAADDIVVAEIENWQAVFGGKHITVPV